MLKNYLDRKIVQILFKDRIEFDWAAGTITLKSEFRRMLESAVELCAEEKVLEQYGLTKENMWAEINRQISTEEFIDKVVKKLNKKQLI